MYFFKEMPVDVALQMMGIPITPDVQRMLDSAKKFMPDADPGKILAIITGLQAFNGIKAYAARIVAALEAIPAELKQQTLEIELQSGWIKVLAEAVNNNIVDRDHTTR